MISYVHNCFGLQKKTFCVLFKIFHAIYIFTPTEGQLDKLVLLAKDIFFVCLKFNISFK